MITGCLCILTRLNIWRKFSHFRNRAAWTNYIFLDDSPLFPEVIVIQLNCTIQCILVYAHFESLYFATNISDVFASDNNTTLSRMEGSLKARFKTFSVRENMVIRKLFCMALTYNSSYHHWFPHNCIALTCQNAVSVIISWFAFRGAMGASNENAQIYSALFSSYRLWRAYFVLKLCKDIALDGAKQQVFAILRAKRPFLRDSKLPCTFVTKTLPR